MAKHAGTYAWSAATTIGDYQTELDGLLDAIAATSANWTKVKAATVYLTFYVWGVVEHSTGLQVAFCVGTENSPVDVTNLAETSDVDDRIYMAYCPQRSTGFNLSDDPYTAYLCRDAGASEFYAFNNADIHGAAREFNWRLDDDAGLFLFEYEATVGTPACFAAISGSGGPQNALYRSDSILTGDIYTDFMLIRRGSQLAYNDGLVGVAPDTEGNWVYSGGKYSNTITTPVNSGSFAAGVNPTQPWVYVEASLNVTTLVNGVRGVIDRDWFGHVREGAVVGGDLTQLESGTYEHLTDGLVWVDP